MAPRALADRPASPRTPRAVVRLGRLGLLVVLGGVFLGEACAHPDYFAGTTIQRSEQNRKIIETVEQYRQRLLARNVDGLLVLASDKYFEDSGTPRSDDDYGYDGLRQVLTNQLKRVKSMRYEIEYRNIKVTGTRAEVEVFLDGSFELAADAGDRYRRVNDYHRFVLEEKGDEWKFLSGM
ncbi:MAG TPA: hypothetical protein VG319_08480 [Polyangia bacterium]|jgi:hypothetical protein|nr:hypothetical protein [Polyangia bacterium]